MAPRQRRRGHTVHFHPVVSPNARRSPQDVRTHARPARSRYLIFTITVCPLFISAGSFLPAAKTVSLTPCSFLLFFAAVKFQLASARTGTAFSPLYFRAFRGPAATQESTSRPSVGSCRGRCSNRLLDGRLRNSITSNLFL